ncbi:MAG TPA: Re/Si-specific NAD(P)(+) transhydrogenase subunit alpha, partial [Kofleriaceae bacterium]|nr:Re/Si-specific NAD(P)(+) transhydrogenase subunit alpha [Kofleriaceae bacterium]
AKVLVIGAGVAGLAAVGAARGLGAIVRAFDTREAVRDQVKSLGGEFLSVDIEESGEGAGGYARTMSKEFIEAEMKLFAEQAKEVDIVITTALIPGKPAPKLWKDYMVEAMKPGSVVVDLAAEQGGNCDLTEPGKAVVRHGVTIIGYTDMASRMANVSSELYGTNLSHLLEDMGDAEGFHIDHDDEVVRTALITEGGKVMWPPPPKPAAPRPAENKPLVKEVQAPEPTKPAVAPPSPVGGGLRPIIVSLAILALAGGWLYLRLTADTRTVSLETHQLLQHLTVFVLAIFVGWQVIWNVSPALHTPLMAVTNAISGIIIIGGMLQQGDSSSASVIIGAVATLFAAINVAGGFLVTQRMLKMFRK